MISYKPGDLCRAEAKDCNRLVMFLYSTKGKLFFMVVMGFNDRDRQPGTVFSTLLEVSRWQKV
jgi:hypothetical protein